MEQNVNNDEIKTIEEDKLVLSRKDFIFAGICTIVAIMFSSMCLWGGFHLGFTLTFIIMFTACTIYLYNKKKPLKKYPFICGILSVVLNLSFSITSNRMVRFWSFFVVIGLSVIWFNSLVNDKEEAGDLGIIRMIFRSVFKGSAYNVTVAVKGLLAGEGRYRKHIGNVVIGLLLAIPVLLLVIPLLMSSDAAFEGMVFNFFTDSSDTFAKLIVGILLAPFIISFGFALSKNRVPKRKESNFKGVAEVMIISFLSMLSLCYLMYLFSQLAYFFSGFLGILPENYEFSVAEYARRGFFEMSIIAGINFCIIFTCLLISRKKENKICVASRILCTFVGGFTLVIIGTALSKMILYINRFGMTQLRITTSAFMIFLTIIFISLIIRLYVYKVQVVKIAFVTAAVVLSVLGIGNANHMVAAYNYYAYENDKLETIDVETIFDQGPEGIPYLVKLAEDEGVSRDAKSELYSVLRYADYYEISEYADDIIMVGSKTDDDFEQYYYSKEKAWEALDELLENGFELYDQRFIKEN